MTVLAVAGMEEVVEWLLCVRSGWIGTKMGVGMKSWWVTGPKSDTREGAFLGSIGKIRHCRSSVGVR